jgi:hypothetical protein
MNKVQVVAVLRCSVFSSGSLNLREVPLPDTV